MLNGQTRSDAAETAEFGTLRLRAPVEKKEGSVDRMEQTREQVAMNPNGIVLYAPPPIPEPPLSRLPLLASLATARAGILRQRQVENGAPF